MNKELEVTIVEQESGMKNGRYCFWEAHGLVWRQTHRQIITDPHNKDCNKGSEDNTKMTDSLEKLVPSSKTSGPKNQQKTT